MTDNLARKSAVVFPLRKPTPSTSVPVSVGAWGGADFFPAARAYAKQVGRLAKGRVIQLPALVDAFGKLADYATAARQQKKDAPAATKLLIDLIEAANILRRVYNKRVNAVSVKNMGASWVGCGYEPYPERGTPLKGEEATSGPGESAQTPSSAPKEEKGFWQYMAEKKKMTDQHLDKIYGVAWGGVLRDFNPKEDRFPARFGQYTALVTAALGHLPAGMKKPVRSWYKGLRQEAGKRKPDSPYAEGVVRLMTVASLPLAPQKRGRKAEKSPSSAPTPAPGNVGA